MNKIPKDKHIPVSIKNERIDCSCGWFYEDIRLADYGPIGKVDKLLDSHNEHNAAMKAFRCVECGRDRREHVEAKHKWKL